MKQPAKFGPRPLNLRTGERPLHEGQLAYLAWLCGEREPGETQATIAARLGVALSTLGKWRRDEDFKREWERQMRDGAANPEILTRQLEVLNKKALTGDVKAIELYWKLVDRMTPDRVEHSGPGSAAGLSDAELAARLQAAAETTAKRVEPETPAECAARMRRDLGME
jgi:hypothetical protein